jgi:hypothetical protein
VVVGDLVGPRPDLAIDYHAQLLIVSEIAALLAVVTGLRLQGLSLILLTLRWDGAVSVYSSRRGPGS